MGYEAIPHELKREKAWVNVWNNSKIPMRSSERKAASSVVPDTWSSFEQAEAAAASGTYDGIGYVFHDTGLIGIDIDIGFDGPFLSQVSVDIMGACRSYTEKSRSGRGVHILVRGRLPFTGKNNLAGIEIYKSSRYFIMTGKVLLYHEIIENQEAIDYVVGRYFQESERTSSGKMVQRIYTPMYSKPTSGKISVRPYYPPVLEGGRNVSLTSLAGQMHNQGYSKSQIYRELLFANQQACSPPLPESEVRQIVNSVTRYRR